MLAAMPRYEAYKDSGIEWLGEIPANWNIKKLKHLGYIYAGLAGKKGDHFSKEKKDQLFSIRAIYKHIKRFNRC